MRSLPAAMATELAAAGLRLVTDPAVLVGHATDWTGRSGVLPLALVRPWRADQVALVLQVARVAGVAVQIQGGNTGLVGGSVPDRPALLLSTVGLDRIGQVDPVERTVEVGAGVRAATLGGHAGARGLRLGVDLASRDTATVGGMAATNAGGLAVCAYGMMREQVRGLRAVLADGRVIDTIGRPAKDNTGYQLDGLLVGSEGTLGVITDLELELHPLPGERVVAVLGEPNLGRAVADARALQAAGARLTAAEVVDAPGAARAAADLGQPDPMPPGAAWLLLVDVAGPADALAPVADRVLAVATDRADIARLWAIRERQTELYARTRDVTKLDVSLRLTHLEEGVAVLRDLVDQAPPARLGLFGHALDGNLHVQLVDPPEGLADRCLRAIAGLGGSISAEHGIGRDKAGLLHLVHGRDEIAWMRQIRAGVDPVGLLNPGVLFG